MNPYSIIIHCDGAMNYDKNSTGGNGFIIEFPDDLNRESIKVSIRNDNQGINRLEMISIQEAVRELLRVNAKEEIFKNITGGVIIYTDRNSVTDEGQLNTYRIAEYRRNKWKTIEGREVKNKDLIDSIDKDRHKLAKLISGRVEIKYKREKYNKVADKLSRVGKSMIIQSKSTRLQKNVMVTRRKYTGSAVDYSQIGIGEVLVVRVYKWEQVNKQVEISAEIVSVEYHGRKIVIYISTSEKNSVHRSKNYEVEVLKVNKHYIIVKNWKLLE
jgi:ribonuclease HI